MSDYARYQCVKRLPPPQEVIYATLWHTSVKCSIINFHGNELWTLGFDSYSLVSKLDLVLYQDPTQEVRVL